MNGTRAHPRRGHPARLGAVVVACACAAVALAGCAEGEGYGTETQVAAVNGANATIGPIAVRNAVFAYPDQGDVYPPGAKVPLLVTIVNTGDRADTLVRVTTPVAAGVAVEGETTIPAGFMVSSLNDADNDLRPVTGASSPPSGADAPPHLSYPASIDGGEVRIVLTSLTRPLRPGLTYPVTLHFRKAGNITLPVPLSLPAGTIGQPGAGVG